MANNDNTAAFLREASGVLLDDLLTLTQISDFCGKHGIDYTNPAEINISSRERSRRLRDDLASFGTEYDLDEFSDKLVSAESTLGGFKRRLGVHIRHAYSLKGTRTYIKTLGVYPVDDLKPLYT
ncbi:MAG: hypothetical protein ABIJ92_04550 [Candidatus Aenigmatarchaeota archaeon]